MQRRAAEQFIAKNLHLTRERTGVMIFVSLGERMAELIADEGIADHVDAARLGQGHGGADRRA